MASSVSSSTLSRKRAPAPFLDWGSFAGMVHGSFFRAPDWVDVSLPPGTTSEEASYGANPKWKSILTGHFLFFSPNFVWLVVAFVVYFVMPYDMEIAQDFGNSHFQTWIRNRVLLNVILVLAYDGFWHGVLYGLGWAKRPFASGRQYRWSKTSHNVYYTVLGAIQWTAWEAIMVHLYATGRIGYLTDEEAFGTVKGALNFYFTCMLVPIFRDIHFFFVHRFTHNRFVYKYIHALHHRNTDIEPFSGLCMSPMEHLYYFSSIAPSVYWHASPFCFLWNGIHLILAPGASHSGWEDQWQSDQFHYAHHRFFECNYGTRTFPLDKLFGCFRETLAPQTKAYRGQAMECVSSETKKSDDNNGVPVVVAARADSKATLWGLPPWDQVVYHLATVVVLPWSLCAALLHREDTMLVSMSGSSLATVVAWMIAVGPLAVALLLSSITANPGTFSSLEKTRLYLLYPFQKEAVFGRYGIMIGMATLVSIMPIYHFAHSLLVQDPRDTIYHSIWG